MYGLLVEPARIVALLPDVDVLDLRAEDSDLVRGRVRTGVSFLKGTFNVEARVVERESPRRARMKVRAQGMGSTVDLETRMELAPEGAGTAVAWKADVAIRGAAATIGARLLPGLVEGKTKDFLEAVRKELEG